MLLCFTFMPTNKKGPPEVQTKRFSLLREFVFHVVSLALLWSCSPRLQVFRFYLLASNSDYDPLLFLGCSTCPALLFLLGGSRKNIKQFIGKLPLLEGDHEKRRVRPTGWRALLARPLPRSPWQTHSWTVTSDRQHDLHKQKAAGINGSKGSETMQAEFATRKIGESDLGQIVIKCHCSCFLLSRDNIVGTRGQRGMFSLKAHWHH